MSQATRELTVRLSLIFISCVVYNVSALAQGCPPGASWCSGTYVYDGMGNIRAIGADTYIYDTAGRLVSGTGDVQRTGILSRQDYSYDALGNRTGASRIAGSVDCLGGCEQSPAIDPATNHITSNGALYDAAGNLIAIQNMVNGVTWSASYTYDAAGSLARATTGSDDRQFIYTADDERIATRNGQNWTWTVRDLDNKVLREFTSLEPNGQPGLPILNRQWSKDYIWRDGLLLASVTPTMPGASTTLTQHFHLDHLGTPRLVSNDAGVQIGIHACYPFGAELNLGGETPSELMKFTGHERDLLASSPNTLDYMHARYDMATMGRFLSVDPGPVHVEHPQSWNRYAYVENNPITYNDPDGRERPYDPKRAWDFAGGDARMKSIGHALASAFDWLAPKAAMAAVIFDAAKMLEMAGPEAMVETFEAESAEAENAALSESAMAGSIRNVNPTGSTTNCVNCAATVDNMLTTGRQASALPSEPKLITTLGTNWISMGSQQNVAQAIGKAGNGARGIVYAGTGQPGTVGHVFNVINQNGAVRFLDGQTGKAVTWVKEWTDIRLLPTY